MENNFYIQLMKVKNTEEKHYKKSLHRIFYHMGDYCSGGSPLSDDWNIRKEEIAEIIKTKFPTRIKRIIIKNPDEEDRKAGLFPLNKSDILKTKNYLTKKYQNIKFIV